MATVLLAGVPLVAVLAALALPLPGGRRLLPVVAWLPATALALLPLVGEVAELPWLLFGTRLGVDALAAPLVLLAAVAWTLSGWHARRTLPQPQQVRFFCFWLLTWCGNLSVFIALDAASFFGAYAFMTLGAYGLIVHRGRPQDYRAGRVYLWMAVLAEGALVGALLLLAVSEGNLPLEMAPATVAGHGQAAWIVVLMLLGFGVKLGLLGMHMWLPLAHPQAPIPASAVLSGVILKAGLMGWLRFLPVGESGYEWLGEGLFVLGFATALFGVAVGATQRGIKALLAYSSVSQMGFLGMIVALALLRAEAAPVALGLAVLFALHHGLAKAGLFLGVDLIRGSPRLARLLVWIPAAALAGLPPTSGLLVKAAVKALLPGEGGYVALCVSIASAATTLLMVRLLALVRAEAATDDHPPWLPWLACLAAALALPWGWVALQAPSLMSPSVDPAVVGEVAWPIVLGAAAGLLLEQVRRRRDLPLVPPGDLINLGWRLRLRLPQWQWRVPMWQLGQMPQTIESGLQRLSVAVVAAVLIAGLMMWL